MMAASVTYKGETLAKALKDFEAAKHAYVKVGVLGDAGRASNPHKNRRWRKGAIFSKGLQVRNAAGKTFDVEPGFLTNAEIGAIHEFGSPGGRIPERSFLRMPILSRLDDELKSQSVSDWRATYAAAGPTGVLRAIGQAAVNVITQAFATGGFGRWAKLKSQTVRRKGSDTILKDTGQLARAITFAVIAPKKGNP